MNNYRMKQLTINIPNDQLVFFKELFEKLGVEITEEQAIPEQHKTIVRERIRKSMPEELQSWKSARKQLNFKSM
jgi:hypothetical protein